MKKYEELNIPTEDTDHLNFAHQKIEDGEHEVGAVGYRPTYTNKEATQFFYDAVKRAMVLTDYDKKAVINACVGSLGIEHVPHWSPEMYADIIYPKLPEDVICMICAQLVYDPMVCSKCGNAIYCKICIDEHKDRRVQCPCGKDLVAKPI